MAERDEAEAAGEFARLLRDSTPLEAGDVASYRRDNLPPRLFQRLKRGQYSVQDELDLHVPPPRRPKPCCASSCSKRMPMSMAACASSMGRDCSPTAARRC